MLTKDFMNQITKIIENLIDQYEHADNGFLFAHITDVMAMQFMPSG